MCNQQSPPPNQRIPWSKIEAARLVIKRYREGKGKIIPTPRIERLASIKKGS